jgi:hypothetical protein
MGHDESRCVQQCSLQVRLGTVAPAQLCIERALESFPCDRRRPGDLEITMILQCHAASA